MDTTESCRSLLARNGFALTMTSGKSMRPLIWGGQHCVAVTPIDGKPAIGDMLMFRQALPDGKERNIVHRLIGIRQCGDQTIYITRGDNCLGCEQVRCPDIIGRVAEVHRISGYRPWHALPFRKFSVNDPACIIYTRIWTATWPARRVCYILRARADALYVRLRSIFKKK